MGNKSKISWCDATFNSWWGCAKVSAGCKFCYADTLQHRYGFDAFGYSEDGSRKPLRTFGEKHWNEPLKLQARAAATGERLKVFCASMGDVFDDVPEAAPHRARLWDLIRATPELDWQLLTKRPGNAWGMVPEGFPAGYEHVWMGTSVEDHTQVRRIELLARTGAGRVRFLSCEPLIGEVRLSEAQVNTTFFGEPEYRPALKFINWVIIGGESGHGARRMDPAWVDRIIADCDAANIPVFVKQTGSVLAREMGLKDLKGGDPAEWPEKWQRQEFPVTPPLTMAGELAMVTEDLAVL